MKVIKDAIVFTVGNALIFNIVLPTWYVLIKLEELKAK